MRLPRIAATAMALFAATPALCETLIPRSMAGDKGRYYLLSAQRKGDVIETLHKRVGVDSVGFTRAETNCRTRRMRELGYGEDKAENIKPAPTQWFALVPGSSKSDLAVFVCKGR